MAGNKEHNYAYKQKAETVPSFRKGLQQSKVLVMPGAQLSTLGPLPTPKNPCNEPRTMPQPSVQAAGIMTAELSGFQAACSYVAVRRYLWHIGAQYAAVHSEPRCA